MDNNSLEVRNLSKDCGDFLLDKISFSIPSGSIMGLVGENGAGKSTTINCILNEIYKTGGDIFIFGKDHLEYETDIKNEIGVIFDECCLPEIFSPIELGRFFSQIYSGWDTHCYKTYLKEFELPYNKPISAFSRGMKVKLNFAIALSHHAKLLILDEATSGLDSIMRDEILDILIEFVQDENHSVLFSSHITGDLEKIADYITFIHCGKVLFSKPKDELLDNYGVVHCGAVDFDRIDKTKIIAYRKQDFEWQVLVSDRNCIGKTENAIVEKATIEDIMLFYVRGELK